MSVNFSAYTFKYIVYVLVLITNLKDGLGTLASMVRYIR